MSRLSIVYSDPSQETVNELFKDAERRIQASQPGLCPVDLAELFVRLCHAQSCGKCTPCRTGLGKLYDLIETVLKGEGDLELLNTIETTAHSIFESADCAIGRKEPAWSSRALPASATITKSISCTDAASASSTSPYPAWRCAPPT